MAFVPTSLPPQIRRRSAGGDTPRGDMPDPSEEGAGCFMAWAGIVARICRDGRDLGPLGAWFEGLAQLRQAFPGMDGAAIERLVLPAALDALALDPSALADRQAWAARGFAGLAAAHARALGAPPRWPPNLQLRALGTFQVMQGGVLLEQRGKGQRRPLDLLKAIIALGGRDVAIENLTAAVWPDAEGDSAKGAFDVAMHRLRKLIGDANVFLVSNGKVSLNPNACRLDVWRFQERARGVHEQVRSQRARADEVLAAAQEMLDSYGGQLLVTEAEQPWMLPMRERLRKQLAHAVDVAACHLRASNREQAAAALCRAAELHGADGG